MKKSITLKITLYFLVFSIVIIGVIGFAAKFILPGYYTRYQLAHIQKTSDEIHETYNPEVPEEVLPLLEQLQEDVGGELYYYTEQGQPKGMGKGRNAGLQSNSEKFIPTGDVTDYIYTNKLGLEVYALGIAIEGEYLVYEVSIQSLSKVVDVVLGFLWILLWVVMILAVVASIILSNNIAKPIKNLNNLAKSMKNKNVEAIMVTNQEDEIGELNHSLNELYEELLSSIYQLETELKKERNAENLKRRFLAQATHELKTPISVIRGYAEILYDGMYKDEDDRDRYLKNIYDESEAISHLIIDVLDYTKMETGNYKLELVQVNALNFYKTLVERFRGYIESHGRSLVLTVHIPEHQMVSVDTNRIEQIMRNLVSNAVEHSKAEIRIKLDGVNGKVRLSVSNDGPTIDEEDIPFIFDSFYKKKGKKPGTGLGLAIVKEVALLHGGEYRVENTENGVRFILII